MSNKIAIFSETYSDYKKLFLSPKSKFKRITDIKQIKKYRFDAVILVTKFDNNQKVLDAFYEFESCYPWLFK